MEKKMIGLALPFMVQDPKLEDVRKTLEERGFNYKEEKLKSDKRYNPVLGKLDEERVTNVDWCCCDGCCNLTHVRENACCQEYKCAKNDLGTTLSDVWIDGQRCVANSDLIICALDKEVARKHRERPRTEKVRKGGQSHEWMKEVLEVALRLRVETLNAKQAERNQPAESEAESDFIDSDDEDALEAQTDSAEKLRTLLEQDAEHEQIDDGNNSDSSCYSVEL